MLKNKGKSPLRRRCFGQEIHLNCWRGYLYDRQRTSKPCCWVQKSLFKGRKKKVLEYTDLNTWCHYHWAKQGRKKPGRKRRKWKFTNKDHNNMWFKGLGGIYCWGQLNGYEGRGEGGSMLGWSGRMSDLNWAQLIVGRRKQLVRKIRKVWHNWRELANYYGWGGVFLWSTKPDDVLRCRPRFKGNC